MFSDEEMKPDCCPQQGNRCQEFIKHRNSYTSSGILSQLLYNQYSHKKCLVNLNSMQPQGIFLKRYINFGGEQKPGNLFVNIS